MDEQLQAKGLTKIDSGGDLLLQVDAAHNTKTRITTDTMGFGPRWGGWVDMADLAVWETPLIGEAEVWLRQEPGVGPLHT